MDKSIIANPETIENLIKSSVNYLKKWSAEQALNIASAIKTGQVPIIIEIGNKGYVVGNYVLIKEENFKWKLCYRYSDFEQIFCNKKAGILSAIYYQTGKSKLADILHENDVKVDRAFKKLKFYEFKLKQKNSDYEKMDFYRVQYNEYYDKLDTAKNLLEKKINFAKYI